MRRSRGCIISPWESRMTVADDDFLETLDIYSTLTQAEWTRMLLGSRDIPATLLDARMTGMFNANVVGGVRLQVPRSLLAQANRILKENPYSAQCQSERIALMEGDVRCPECGSDDLAAVPPRESNTGTYALRCLRCKNQFPVSAETYLQDDFPLLPSACPECGSALLHNVEAPPDREDDVVDRQWVRCDACAHEWEAPIESKPGAPPNAPKKVLESQKEERPELPPAACPRCASVQVMETTKPGDDPDWVRLTCLECGHAWIENECGQQVPLDGSPPQSNEEEAPRLKCPGCASQEVEPTEAPAYAVESALGSFFKHLVGRGWYRCKDCGHVWES